MDARTARYDALLDALAELFVRLLEESEPALEAGSEGAKHAEIDADLTRRADNPQT
ncbi:MAG TPA: hypothetical protein VF329_04235 [Gammaproteobacteria bacterium]